MNDFLPINKKEMHLCENADITIRDFA